MRNSEVGGEAQLWLETTVRFYLQQESRLDYEIWILFLCDYGIFVRKYFVWTADSYDLRGVDVQTESEDGNPGTFNAFACGGAFCGILVLLADLGKGALPVALCARDLGMDSWMFALVMAAPVFGHAHSLFQKGHGGKAIAVSFGVLIGTASSVAASGSLIFWYLLFVIVISARSNPEKAYIRFWPLLLLLC